MRETVARDDVRMAGSSGRPPPRTVFGLRGRRQANVVRVASPSSSGGESAGPSATVRSELSHHCGGEGRPLHGLWETICPRTAGLRSRVGSEVVQHRCVPPPGLGVASSRRDRQVRGGLCRLSQDSDARSECTMKRCSECGLDKPLDAFHRHRQKHDGRQTVCKDCKRAYNATYYQRNKARHSAMRRANALRLRAAINDMIAAAKAKPCVDCGEAFPRYAMDLDHVRGVKVGDAFVIRRMGLERARAEIAKCEPVCAACHRLRTRHRERRRGRLETAGWSCRPPGT